jgi:hypothetical protein
MVDVDPGRLCDRANLGAAPRAAVGGRSSSVTTITRLDPVANRPAADRRESPDRQVQTGHFVIVFIMIFPISRAGCTLGPLFCDVRHGRTCEGERKVANETISRNWRNHSETDGA